MDTTISDSDGFYEYIVVGCGGIGSAAVYWLSKRAGTGVLGLEQFNIGHDHGGSQDFSRIARLSYHDDDYKDLVLTSYGAWEQIEKESGIPVLFKVGGLNLTKRGGQEDVLNLYCDFMERNNIPFERFDGAELHRRFPQFTTGSDIKVVYQKDGALVDAAMGIAVHLQLARGNGATIIENAPVTRVLRNDDGLVKVCTPKGAFTCRKLVVAAGAWINHVIGSVGGYVPVTVTQEQVTYFASPNMIDFTKDKFPIWIFHDEDGDFYGLPIHGNSGTKIGIDAGGNEVTPGTRTYTPDPNREKKCVQFLQRYIPKSLGPIMRTKTCLYTMPPDRNFVIDTLAEKGFPDIVVCCGAGHAYKFAGILGKTLSELAIDGRSQSDISAFSILRDAITDPTFKRAFHIGFQPKL